VCFFAVGVGVCGVQKCVMCMFLKLSKHCFSYSMKGKKKRKEKKMCEIE